uniref:Uncharacterized protein n=1 Tax=Rhizophora mucronata TaxID=61149 RepID=A0A2P2NQA0_RHIMU
MFWLSEFFVVSTIKTQKNSY